MSTPKSNGGTGWIRSPALRQVVTGRRSRAVLLAAAFVAATAAGAQVAVPLPWTPVPVTLQPLFVLLAGLALGPRLGVSAMVAYLAMGTAGAPVFSGGGAGLPHLLGPTGGYLAAFPAAAGVAGLVAGGAASGTARLGAAVLAGLATLYAGGVAQLAVVTGAGFDRLLALGVAPFLAGDLVKAAIALVAGRALRRRTLGLL